MKISTLILALVLLGGFPARATEGNVILLTLDGVRWQEIFRGSDPEYAPKIPAHQPMPFLWNQVVPNGMILGNVDRGSTMVISNDVQLSLPAYHSIMQGRPTDCRDNDCGFAPWETLVEHLARQWNGSPTQVGAFASWGNLCRAIRHLKIPSGMNNCGNEAFEDGTQDPELLEINSAQAQDRPLWGHRFDRYTYAHGMRFLKKYQPRFLYMGMNDSDEWGHREQYPEYISTLERYDRWIREIRETLDAMGEYGKNTTLIITTDHGRGSTPKDWGHHPYHPEARFIWMAAIGRGVAPQGELFQHPEWQHRDLRSTIETLLGVSPTQCADCGSPIRLAP